MDLQEYELAFVTALPRGAREVDPHTLDFAKSPIGALAFRYKHGWILINPLIPSRGKSGGGLARQHGHLSGGFTVGRFHKNGAGKISFKAHKAYADKADWEKEIKAGAANTVAKQKIAHEAVKAAEGATDHAAKLEADKAPKKALAEAHEAAAQAHSKAADAYQAIGRKGMESGVLTHSAHSAIHSSKAGKLKQEAKEEAAKKAEAEAAAKKAAEEAAKAKAEAEKAKMAKRQAAAKELSDKANGLSTKVKGTSGNYQDKAKAHTEAANAHKAAQDAHELAGNKYVAKAHGAAMSHHEETAAKHQQNHDAQVKAAEIQSDTAMAASEHAFGGGTAGSVHNDSEPLSGQIAAHNKAAQLHSTAATLHSSLGNTDAVAQHQAGAKVHKAKAAQLGKEQEAHKATKAEQDKLVAEGAHAYSQAHGMPELTAEQKLAKAKAFEEATKKTGAAIQHSSAHGLPESSLNAAKHQQMTDFAKKLKADVEKEHQAKVAAEKEKAKLSQAAYDASDKAKAATKQANAAGTSEAHGEALDAHIQAALAGKKAGHAPEMEEFHKKAAKHHATQVAELNKAQQEKAAGAKKALADYEEAKKAADQATLKLHSQPAGAASHQPVAEAHEAAAKAAKAAGLDNAAKMHTESAQKHAKIAGQPEAGGPSENGWSKGAGDAFNLGTDAEDAGDTAAALKHYKQAAALAEMGDNPHLEAAATSAVAKLAGTKENHKAAGIAAAKAVQAEKAKPNPNQNTIDKLMAQLKGHSDAMVHAPAAVTPRPAASGFGKAGSGAGDGKALKPVGQLKDTGKILGTHGSKLMEDEAGNKWLNKADPEGYARALDPAVAALHRKVGLETPVFVKTKEGHLQGMLPGSKDAFPNGSFNPEKLSETDVMSMLQHQVMDYVTGNQDTHSGQWLRDKDGKLIQVDQGQAFKFGVGQGDPTKTHPPIGSDVPVYPKLWNAAKAGLVHIPDPNGDNAFAKTIQAVQDLPDDQFKALFKPYAVQVMKNGHNPGGHSTVEGFLDEIAANKNKVGEAFQKLYNDLPQAKASSGDSALSPKDQALKALAQHEQAQGSLSKGATLEKLALAAGASKEEVKAAGSNPSAFLATVGKPSAPASPDEALKALATYVDGPGDEWSLKKVQELKKAAQAAGVPADDITDAVYNPAMVLNKLKAKATPEVSAGGGWGAKAEAAATAKADAEAVAKAKAEAFKPKAKWSKATKSVSVSDGAGGSTSQEVSAVQGPKDLAVHKAVSGSGWTLSTADGLSLGSAGQFKTQKEAKLAAEWAASQVGVSSFHKDAFQEWGKKNPEKLAEFKKGFAAKQWNVEAQAKVDKLAATSAPPAAPSAPSAAPSAPSAAPSAPQPGKAAAPLSAKNQALKALAEFGLPENDDAWTYDKEISLMQAAKAAGATGDEISAANTKPKTFLKNLGVTPGAPPAASAAPGITYEGLSNDKVANAQLLKKLYNQAEAPGATAAQKAMYAQAAKDWQNKHSTGPFDPSKVLAPGEVPPLGSQPNPTAGPSQHSIKKGGNPGFTPYNPTGGKDPKWNSTDPEVIAANTKKVSLSSYERGYRMVPLTVSANGDWKPAASQMGPGTGAYIYSTNSYSSINMQLRGNAKKGIAPVGAKGGHWDEVIAHADSIFDSVPPSTEPILTVRNMQDSGQFPVPPPPLAKGAEFIDHGFGSTSKSVGNWSGSVQMQIRIPPGAKFLDLNHTVGSDNASEMELLLPRDTKYRVITDSWSEPGASPTGTRKLVVEIVV